MDTGNKKGSRNENFETRPATVTDLILSFKKPNVRKTKATKKLKTDAFFLFR